FRRHCRFQSTGRQRMDSAFLAGLVMSVALGLSIALMPPVRVLARQWGVIDAPGERKVHSVPMPRLGGLAVFCAFNIVVIAGFALAPRLGTLSWARAYFESIVVPLQEAYRVQTKLLAVLVGAAIAFGVGLLDDVLGDRFPVWAKALGQVVATLLLIAAGVQ